MNERLKELAKQAGLDDGVFPLDGWEHPELTKFAELVIADEREACAQLCDELIAPEGYSDTELSMWDVTCIDCASAIRARSET